MGGPRVIGYIDLDLVPKNTKKRTMTKPKVDDYDICSGCGQPVYTSECSRCLDI